MNFCCGSGKKLLWFKNKLKKRKKNIYKKIKIKSLFLTIGLLLAVRRQSVKI